MENEVVQPLINSGEVIMWKRYVDDVICIVKKDKIDSVFEKINSFDDWLKFTVENVDKNYEIAFLDTKIYLDQNNILQHKYYKKDIASTVVLNYKNAVVPRKYLISTLVEIFVT